MRFNVEETELILAILNPFIQQEQVALIIDKLNNKEYIKGRILKFLFSKLSNDSVVLEADKTEALQLILHKIKFKATPR